MLKQFPSQSAGDRIRLSRGLSAQIDEGDYSDLSQFNWFVWVPHNAKHLTYAVRKIRKSDGSYSKELMHRRILKAEPGSTVDHRNGDTLDNRRTNLRFVTASQNSANSRKHKDGSSGFRGVTWHCGNKKWQASVQFQKKRVYVGNFDDKKKAALAYNKKAKELHGDYAKLNVI
jgi:HNH endonuclease